MTKRRIAVLIGLLCAARVEAQVKPLPPDTSGPKLRPAPAKAPPPPRPGARGAVADQSPAFVSKPLPAPATTLEKPPAKPVEATVTPLAPRMPAIAPPPKPGSTGSTAEIESANRQARLETPPANATGRCRDGTWLYGAITDQSCAAHGGGDAIRFSLPQAPPPPPRRP